MSEELDSITEIVGDFGLWQGLLLIPYGIHFVFQSFQTLGTTFLTLEPPDFFCKIDTKEDIFRSYDLNPILEDGTRDRCKIFNIDYCNLTDQNPGEEFKIDSSVGTRNCTDFVFDLSKFDSSVITDFDLVCDREWLITFSKVVFMVGKLAGVLVSGFVSDKFGRKTAIIASAILSSLFSILTAFADSIMFFIFLRFLVAATSLAYFTIYYVYIMEIVGKSWKTWLGIGLEFPWAFGYTVLPGIAYLIRDWRTLQLVISVPTTILIPIYFFIPESPRWLLAKGRTTEAKTILKKAVKVNRLDVEKIKFIFQENPETPRNSGGVANLFKSSNLRRNTLIQFFNWFTVSMIYYGLTFDSGSIVPGNIYINFAISGLVEFPAYGFCLVVLYFLGRKIPLASMFFLAGAALLGTLFTEDKSTILILATIGKFGVISAFGIIYVQAAELFPTVVRSSGIGSSSACGRIGAILAPIVCRELYYFSGQHKSGSVGDIFAATSILAGILTFCLPETNNRRLPDSIEDGEEFSGDLKSNCCGRK